MNTQYYPRSTVSHQAMMRLLQLMGYMRQKGFRDGQVEQADCSALSLAGLSFNADSAHPILWVAKDKCPYWAFCLALVEWVLTQIDLVARHHCLLIMESQTIVMRYVVQDRLEALLRRRYPQGGYQVSVSSDFLLMSLIATFDFLIPLDGPSPSNHWAGIPILIGLKPSSFFLASVSLFVFPLWSLRMVYVFALPNQLLSFGFHIQPCSLLAERGEGAEKHEKHLSISAAYGN